MYIYAQMKDFLPTTTSMLFKQYLRKILNYEEEKSAPVHREKLPRSSDTNLHAEREKKEVLTARSKGEETGREVLEDVVGTGKNESGH